jgi:EpsI family protein
MNDAKREILRFGCLWGVLLLAFIGIRSMSRGKPVPLQQQLSLIPQRIGEWAGQDLPDLPYAEKRVLRADDYLVRAYNSPQGQLGVLIAYYQQQRSGDALHSPKNCLPGAGWNPIESTVISVPGGRDGRLPFEANYYILEKDGVEVEVVYWYQAGARSFASEYTGKLLMVWESVAASRTDGSLIRITATPTSKLARKLPVMVDFSTKLANVLPSFLPK